MRINLDAVFFDNWRLIKKMTFARLTNAVWLLLSFYISKWIKKPLKTRQPIAISIEPTTACNLRCPECPSGLRSFTRPTGKLDKNLYQRMIHQIKRQTLYLTLYFQGEPYLHPDFFELIRIANQAKLYTSTSTNAHFLDEERAKKTVESGLDRLIISIDGTDQGTYASYRKEGKLDKVIEGTKNIVNWRKKLKKNAPLILFQFLVVRPNEHQIEDIKALAKKLKVDQVLFKSAQIYNYENGSPLIPTQPKYSRYKKLGDGTYTLKYKLDNHCWKMWHSCVMTWDGNIVPCCFDKDAQHRLGNISNEPLHTIWHNEKYKHFRKNLLLGRTTTDICKNCSEGTKVWV